MKIRNNSKDNISSWTWALDLAHPNEILFRLYPKTLNTIYQEIDERNQTNVVPHWKCLLYLQRPIVSFYEEKKECSWERIQNLLQCN